MNKAILVVVALVIIGGGAYVLTSSSGDDTTEDTNSQTEATQATSDRQQAGNDTPAEQAQEQDSDDDFGSVQTVIYDENGFSPERLTSKAGEKMIIENKTSSLIQVQSDPHPGHSDNDELNVGAIPAGGSETVTLTTKGTFGFHDHLNPENSATVVVQ